MATQVSSRLALEPVNKSNNTAVNDETKRGRAGRALGQRPLCTAASLGHQGEQWSTSLSKALKGNTEGPRTTGEKNYDERRTADGEGANDDELEFRGA